MDKMSKDCYQLLVRMIERHLTPMYFNTGVPILCIVNSEVRKLEKEIYKELVAEGE